MTMSIPSTNGFVPAGQPLPQNGFTLGPAPNPTSGFVPNPNQMAQPGVAPAPQFPQSFGPPQFPQFMPQQGPVAHDAMAVAAELLAASKRLEAAARGLVRQDHADWLARLDGRLARLESMLSRPGLALALEALAERSKPAPVEPLPLAGVAPSSVEVSNRTPDPDVAALLNQPGVAAAIRALVAEREATGP